MNDRQEMAELTLFLAAALARESTENIRAVTVSEKENYIDLRFIFYKHPSFEEIEAMGYVGTELLSNYDEKFGGERYEVVPDGKIFLNEGEFIAYEKG